MRAGTGRMSAGLHPVVDIDLESMATLRDTLMVDKHRDYLVKSATNKQDYEYVMSEYLRMGGVYWTLTALDLINCLDAMAGEREQIIAFVRSCQHECGGFGAAVGHDPQLLHTLSAVQVMCLYGEDLDTIRPQQVVSYVKSLQLADGSFAGDRWGEVDTRFSFCAVATLALLGRLGDIDRERTAAYVRRCMNFDGGFSTQPGSESHAGQIYCCIGTLSILHQLECIDADLLGFWLSERQLPSGGLNGRPEKLPDVCYSWWVVASMEIIGRLSYINKRKLRRYIFACQDCDTGGFTDRPGDMADPFHTLFGLAGLSLIALDGNEIQKINPVFCMPQCVIDRLGIKLQLL